MDANGKFQVLTIWVKRTGENAGEIYLGSKMEQSSGTLGRCGWECMGEIFTTISKAELEAGICYQLQKENQRLSERLGKIQQLVDGY